jgi:hypothetical protein
VNVASNHPWHSTATGKLSVAADQSVFGARKSRICGSPVASHPRTIRVTAAEFSRMSKILPAQQLVSTILFGSQ